MYTVHVFILVHVIIVIIFQQLPLLGGVPLMLLSKDMSNTLPDEKVGF